MKTNRSMAKFKPGLVRFQNGSVLLEAVTALVLLSVAGLALLKGSLNTLAPRQWTLIQNITDAHLTYEQAYAERIPFEELTTSGSPWPVYPAKSSVTQILGTLPGGSEVSGTVIRTRIADSNNLPVHGGSGTSLTNPAEMQVWQVRTVLLYEIGGRDYVKTRNSVRSQ